MIDLIPCTDDHRWQIYAWRNSPEVRKYMYTTAPISRDDHDRWYDALLTTTDRRGWIVRLDTQPVGAAFITGIDEVNRRATWAFYLADTAARGRGVGGAVEFAVLEYAFSDLKLHKLCCEVLSFNRAVVAMHERFGFVQEGLLRDHWIRDGEFVHTHVLAIFEDVWRARREETAAVLRGKGLIA